MQCDMCNVCQIWVVFLQVWDLTCLTAFWDETVLLHNPSQVSLTCLTSVFWTVETMSASQLKPCTL